MLLFRKYRSYLLLSLSLVILLFAAARFIHIDADFPENVTRAGGIYTNEGWYSSGAVRDYVTGSWYLDGDFNPAVNMPVGQIVNRALFSMFGLHLATVRMTSAISMALVILLSGFLVGRHFGIFTGLLAALMVSTSFLGYAYSRLAVMEPLAMALVLFSIVIADSGKRVVSAFFSGIVLGLAVLAKTSMVFALPVVMYVAFRAGTTMRTRILLSSISLLSCLMIFRSYDALAVHLYYVDYHYFNYINISDRLVSDFSSLMTQINDRFSSLMGLEGWVLALLLVLVPVALVVSAGFRKSILVQAMLAYLLIYFTMIVSVEYGPPRYLVPLIVPISILTATSGVELARNLVATRMKAMAFPLIGLVLVAASINAYAIVHYMSNLSYSYRNMMAGIREILQDRKEDLSKVVLLGGMADSIALETGVRSVNVLIGTKGLQWRIETYRPDYLVWFGEGPKYSHVIEHKTGGKLSELGRWDIYHNYESGFPVVLYSISWPVSPSPGQSVQ